MNSNENTGGALSRAQGCLLGQLAGDSLGSLVEFQHADQIQHRHPQGLHELQDGGTWDTLAGQPTDDSEMALLLARLLVKSGWYSDRAAFLEYRLWMSSQPFDCGNTIRAALTATRNEESQANGALMRVSPLGIFGARFSTDQVVKWAQADARVTHPHPICQQVNGLYAAAIADAIRSGRTAEDTHRQIAAWADEWDVDPVIRQVIARSERETPADFSELQGWVLLAFQNALYQLLHAPNTAHAVKDTVMRGGDTDTNAAICGALWGAVEGRSGIPEQWERAILTCRPELGKEGVMQPRPAVFWPVDALELAEALVSGSRT
jgi:ADP-ribosylglycohydrolase